jgi:cell wall-associated NlpC family hydrolase
MKYLLVIFTCSLLLMSCFNGGQEEDDMIYEDETSILTPGDTLVPGTQLPAVVDTNLTDYTLVDKNTQRIKINTGDTKPEELVYFAKELIGVPYLYASADPKVGFDCSGFITYVFNRFNIAVPRSSVDFTNVDREVPRWAAKPGDLILFTGTDSTVRIVGHMGIVLENKGDTINFIHSSSGKANGVTISPLNGYYEGRFEKILRIFPD